ncbi:MAG: phosphatase PAP2 family protein [Actinomycetes bacterium]
MRTHESAGLALPTDHPAEVATARPPLPATGAVLTLLGAAASVFLAVLLLVLAHATAGFDATLLGWSAAAKQAGPAQVARVITTLGDTGPLLTILVLAAVLVPMRWGGGWRLLILPCAAAALAFAASSMIKHAVGRARPPAVDWAGPAHGAAFPSGHATSATAGYLTLAILVAGLLPAARYRAAVLAVGIGLPLLIGASRVVLAVHWPTDVLAGWALGAAVAAAALAVTRTTPTLFDTQGTRATHGTSATSEDPPALDSQQ